MSNPSGAGNAQAKQPGPNSKDPAGQAVAPLQAVGTIPKTTALMTQSIKKTTTSASLYDEARTLIPGGASSILRWASYEPYPIYIDRGMGPRVVDVDGNEYLDYLLRFGAMINGHSHPWMGMTVDHRSKAEQIVEILISINIDNSRPHSTINVNRIGLIRCPP